MRFLPALSDRLRKPKTTLGSVFAQANGKYFEPTLEHATLDFFNLIGT
ncbi:MAG: hypothetical protein QNL80_13510 [Akkermansiaceae bacterium]